MKIKRLAVTYVDKIVLAAMVCVFAWAGYRAFFRGSPEKDELWEAIPRALASLERNLAESSPPPLPEMQDAQILAQRYERLPIVQPYRRYVLFRPTPIQWGVFHFIVGNPREITISKVHLIRLISYDSNFIEVSPPVLVDEDDPSEGSKIKVTPLRATGSVGTQILTRDIEGVRYVARAIVYTERPRERPLPPREVEVSVHRGRPLLKMRWDNPSPRPADVAETVGFWVYRKQAGRPDETFVLLNEANPAAPDPRARRRIEEELRIGEFAPRHDPSAHLYSEEDEVIEAEIVEERRPRIREREERLAAMERDDFHADLAYFVDRRAEPGETYVYRVVAVTAPVEDERRMSDPWDSQPVPVPSDVEFYLSSVSGDTAHVRVLKRDYDLEFSPGAEFWHDMTFRVLPGMPIGWKRPASYRHPLTNRMERKEVDFNTGAVLVGAYARVPIFEVADSLARDTTPSGLPTSRWVWEAREVETATGYIVVQTRRGRLVKVYRGSPPPERRRARERPRQPDFGEEPEDVY